MSENIFKEIYAKVISLFKQTEKEDNAKDIAKNRLRVVLMQDRTNLTPELLQRMRKELIELLSKYVEMDKEALELNFDQEGDQMALMLSIPVIRAKDEAEIEKELEKEKENKETEEEEKEEKTDESSDEEETDEETTSDDEKEENTEEEKDSDETDKDITEEESTEEETTQDTDDTETSEKENETESKSEKENK